MPSQLSSTRRGSPSGRSGGRTGNRTSGSGGSIRRQRQPLLKFKGNCADLHGQIFDCSDYKQADMYVSTLKRISEYVGASYKHGGDIRSSIINEQKLVIPNPPAVIYASTTTKSADEVVQEKVFHQDLVEMSKRKVVLNDNIQKTYSLVLGQCTDLLQTKLKQQLTWPTVQSDQDGVALLTSEGGFFPYKT